MMMMMVMTTTTTTMTTTTIIHFNSMGVYLHAGLTAQVPITKPAQRHK
jgi:hypothetical protein